MLKIYFYLFARIKINSKKISLEYNFVKAISCAKKLLTLASVKGYSSGLDRKNNGKYFPRVEMAIWHVIGEIIRIFSPGIIENAHLPCKIVWLEWSRRCAIYTRIFAYIGERVDSRGCPQYKTQSQRGLRPKWPTEHCLPRWTYRWLLSRTLRF